MENLLDIKTEAIESNTRIVDGEDKTFRCIVMKGYQVRRVVTEFFLSGFSVDEDGNTSEGYTIATLNPQQIILALRKVLEYVCESTEDTEFLKENNLLFKLAVLNELHTGLKRLKANSPTLKVSGEDE